MDPPRRSGATSCDLHPHDEAFSGSFCPSCLRDRLAGLDASASPSSVPEPGRRSTSSLRVRSLFSQRPSIPSSSVSASASASSSHLRRCKSFSLSHPPGNARGRGSTIHEEEEDLKPMKIHLDLESHSHSRPRHSTSIPSNSNTNSNSNFLIRKWHQWRGKHTHRKQQHCTNNSAVAPPMPLPHHGAHGPTITGSRRSCDTEPRFSIDAGRVSFDCPPRFSFDEPRASWDGYSATARPINYSRFHPVLSAADCAPDPAAIHRYDDQIPVEDESAIPGSQAQTRDYYLDSSSSSRRRRSFERSASMRKGPQPQLEIEAEHRSIPAFNSKVSPAGGAEFYHYHHTIATRDGDGMSGSFSSVFQDPIAEKKPKKWSKGWNLWGLIQKKGNSKDQSANTNHVSSNHPEHFMRCNSSVSARSSFSSYNATGGSMRRNSVDMININNTHTNTNNGYSKKRRDEFVLERNRSARFSPGRVDNSMLRFYLTPMMGNQSGRRSSSGVRPVSTGSQSLSARPVHRLY